MKQASIWTIPYHKSFLDDLAQGIWERVDRNPEKLTDVTVLLPNRRACREIANAFLRILDGRAVLLPRLFPVGDLDEDEIFFYGTDKGETILKVPAAITSTERQLYLATILQEIVDGDIYQDLQWSAAQFLNLAGDLCLLLDQLQIEEIDIAKIQNLAPDELSEHWQKTLNILKSITDIWPQRLSDMGMIDPVQRRNQLIHRQADFWQKYPPQEMIIAAGSTGTMPATARLLKVVSELPNGHLVLPGLDETLDEESWQKIEATHPQYSLKKLLDYLSVNRTNILPWLDSDVDKSKRHRLVSEVMRPAQTTDKWLESREKFIDLDTNRISLLELKNQSEEADAIALILRETLIEEGRSACLITPDRNLARRVKSAMRRWGIDVDDSAGEPLHKSTIGQWLILTAHVTDFILNADTREFDTVKFLAFLKHPYCALQREKKELENLISDIEHNELRSASKMAVHFNDIKTYQFISEIIDNVKKKQKPSSFHEMLQMHLELAEEWFLHEEKRTSNDMWSGDDGRCAAACIAELFQLFEKINFNDFLTLILHQGGYEAALESFLQKVTIRSQMSAHPRLSILGQMESRLHRSDRVILAGLNESVWPPEPENDPWLSKAMRQKLGLPPAERVIGLAAHDFAKGLCADEVFITRARKINGTPTVPAPWILRLKAVLRAAEKEIDDGAHWHKIHQYLDSPTSAEKGAQSLLRPVAQPPKNARPRRISVTAIESLMRDPYVFYTQRILKINPLEPLSNKPLYLQKGTLFHDVLEEFVKSHKDKIKDDDIEALLQIGAREIEKIYPEKKARYQFLWAEFLRISNEFISKEKTWRQTSYPVALEEKGILPLNGVDIVAKFDRIDRKRDASGYIIIDYKTGVSPIGLDVKKGFAPQLTLESLILANGHFDKDFRIQKNDTADIDMQYWTLKSEKNASFYKTPEQRDILVEQAQQGLEKLLELFMEDGIAYLSKPHGENISDKYKSLDHFIRFDEWQAEKENITHTENIVKNDAA